MGRHPEYDHLMESAHQDEEGNPTFPGHRESRKMYETSPCPFDIEGCEGNHHEGQPCTGIRLNDFLDFPADDSRTLASDSTCGNRDCGHTFDIHSVNNPGCGCGALDCKGRIERPEDLGIEAEMDAIRGGTREEVIREIWDEIENGDAHLMTRNELAEFIDWWINLDDDDNANAVIYDEMNNGNASVARHKRIAKRFFVHKGYEV